jgi:hypothetical protein
MLDVIAEHSVALLGVIRALIETGGQAPTGPGEPPPDGAGPDGPGPDDAPPAGPGRYQHIPVTVEE